MRVLARFARLALATSCIFAARAPRAQSPTRVTVGISNSVTDIGFFVADRKGYFKRENLAVELVPFDSGAKMIAPFASGDLDVGAGGASSAFFNAVSRGIDVRVVADKGSTPLGRPISFLSVRRDLVDSGVYKGLADLKGRKIALAASGGVLTPVIMRALARNNMSLSDVALTYMGFPQQAAALRNRAIDIGFPTEPFVTELEKAGVITRFEGDDTIYPDHQIAAMIYSGQFIKNKGVAAQRFMRAYLQGIRDYSDAIDNGRLTGAKGDEMVSILVDYTQVKDASVHRAVAPVFIDPDGRLNEASMREDVAALQKEGTIEGQPDVSKAIDRSFVAAFVREAGAYKRR